MVDPTTDPSTAHVLGRLRVIEDRVREVVAHRRVEDPTPDDPFRGLYVSDEIVDRLLGERDPAPSHMTTRILTTEADADVAEQHGQPIRLRTVARAAELTDLDVNLLLLALLPDLDSRFERLYGYLNDDVTRRRATVGLGLELAGATAMSAAARHRLTPSGPLVRQGLVMIEDVDRPFLTRGLRVPDRVTAHLLADDALDPRLLDVTYDPFPHDSYMAEAIARSLAAGVRLVYVRESEHLTGASTGVAALGRHGSKALALDLRRVAAELDPAEVTAVATREALLTDRGIVAEPVEVLAETSPPALRRLLQGPVPVILVGRATWDPRWTDEPPLCVEAPVLVPSDRSALWALHLGRDSGLDHDTLAGHLTLGPDQVPRAIQAARRSSTLVGGPLTAADLMRGVRTQNAAGLERLARRIEPAVGWDDLVLAPAVTRALRELTARARHRHTVLTTWKMRRGGGRGHGITALFGGDSGTGKTLSAEVIAADLGLDLYTVNLATVVDKYIGETEKNLERIFSEAGGVNAVLFFDEADAIFGKRAEVRDAHDRYANIESAYLLQRLETFDGLAILATNLRSNIDEAFTRRLDAIVDFPAPTPELRRRLWTQCLAAPLPVADDVDIDFCAESFELTGGNIRSASITAAYLAAAGERPVCMVDVVTAVEQEYRKLGRLVLAGEFGEYLSLFG